MKSISIAYAVVLGFSLAVTSLSAREPGERTRGDDRPAQRRIEREAKDDRGVSRREARRASHCEDRRPDRRSDRRQDKVDDSHGGRGHGGDDSKKPSYY